MFSSLFFFSPHSLPIHARVACALIDLPSNGSGQAALSHPSPPRQSADPSKTIVEPIIRLKGGVSSRRAIRGRSNNFTCRYPKKWLGLLVTIARAARVGTRSAAIRPPNMDINFMRLLDGLFGGGECWAKIIWTDESLTNVTYDARRCRSNCGARRLSRKNRRYFREKFGDEIPRLLFVAISPLGWMVFSKEVTRSINWSLEGWKIFAWVGGLLGE